MVNRFQIPILGSLHQKYVCPGQQLFSTEKSKQTESETGTETGFHNIGQIFTQCSHPIKLGSNPNVPETLHPRQSRSPETGRSLCRSLLSPC